MHIYLLSIQYSIQALYLYPYLYKIQYLIYLLTQINKPYLSLFAFFYLHIEHIFIHLNFKSLLKSMSDECSMAIELIISIVILYLIQAYNLKD